MPFLTDIFYHGKSIGINAYSITRIYADYNIFE